MKGSAGSLVTLVNWLGSWIASYAFNFLLVWNSYGKYMQQAEDNFGQSGSTSKNINDSKISSLLLLIMYCSCMYGMQAHSSSSQASVASQLCLWRG